MINIAVLSDIHGNYISLQRCLEYAINDGVSKFIFLGDYLGELAYPQKTMELLYKLKEKYKCFFIRGNREEYWLNYRQDPKGWKEYDSTTGSLYYVYHNLTQRDLDFFQLLSIREELIFEGLPPLTVCHGSPRRVNEQLLPDNKNTLLLMESEPNDYILCGHTHRQKEIEHNGKVVLDTGSVGIPIHSQGKAQFMILRGEHGLWAHEFVSLEYDREEVIEDLHRSGLSERAPYWCKVSEHLLRTGEISHGSALERAMRICQNKYGKCTWPDVPEECWEQAVKEMIGEV